VTIEYILNVWKLHRQKALLDLPIQRQYFPSSRSLLSKVASTTPIHAAPCHADVVSFSHGCNVQKIRALSNPTQASLPQSAFLVCLSSLASVFLRPHLLLICASSLSLFSLISGAEQHKLTKNCEHSNFSANFTLVQTLGSVVLSLRISSTWTGVRWYFFSYCARTAVGSTPESFGSCVPEALPGVEGGVELEVGALKRRLGSFGGRNFCGV